MPLSGMPFRPSDQRHLVLVAAAIIVDHLGALAAIACLKNMLCHVMQMLCQLADAREVGMLILIKEKSPHLDFG